MDTRTLHINVPTCDISRDAHKISEFVMDISSLLEELAACLNKYEQVADLSCYLQTVAKQISMGPVAVHRGFAAIFETIKDYIPEEALHSGSEVIRVSPFAGYENDAEFSETMKLVRGRKSVFVPFHSRSTQ